MRTQRWTLAVVPDDLSLNQDHRTVRSAASGRIIRSARPGRIGQFVAGALSALAVLAAALPSAAAAEVSLPQPSLPIGIVDLTNVYRGDDGALMYTRAVGSRVVGFAEHPRQGVAFAFTGTLIGSTITGSWWDLPKGSRTQRGALSITHSQAGATLTRSGGADFGAETWTKIDPQTITSWPGDRRAGFQSTAGNDLDGAFEVPHTAQSAADRVYARETGEDVVFVIERRFAAEPARPSWVAAFFGKRTAGGIVGEWFGLPKGGILRYGAFIAGMSAFNRDFSVSAWDTSTFLDDTLYKPDYTVNHSVFAQQIESRLDDNVIGYSYAIAEKGKIVASNGSGRRAIAPELPFTVNTEIDIASTSKTVTAVAVVRALFLRGMTVGAKVDPYLPAAWKRGPGMEGLTFRRLLDHTADLWHPGNICGTDPYKCLKDAVAGGLTANRPDDDNYNNIHYAIMRVILPFLVDNAKMKQAFADHDPETDGAILNEIFSDSFSNYVLGMLAAEGVSASFAFQTSDWAYGYETNPFEGSFYPDQTNLKVGSGSMKMTAPEYLEFLMAFEAGEFVPWDLVDEMKEDRLGFDDLLKTFTGQSNLGYDLGFLYTKNGGSGGYASQSQLYPSDVQAFVILTGTDLQPSLARMLRASYQAALL